MVSLFRRKAKKEKIPKKVISVYLPNAVIDQIDSVSHANGVCRNAYLANLITTFFERKEKGEVYEV
jgi:metal-responsive CopG/Arc/MetJ family transcriptional regulator